MSRRVSTRANSTEGLERKEFTAIGRACKDIMTRLATIPEFAWFKEQVREETAPGYYRIIKKPMYFSLVQANLEGYRYVVLADFVRDVRQIFLNAVTYNSRESPVFRAAQLICERFEKEIADRILPISGEANAFIYEHVIPEATRPVHEATDEIMRVVLQYAAAGSLPALVHAIKRIPPPQCDPIVRVPYLEQPAQSWLATGNTLPSRAASTFHAAGSTVGRASSDIYGAPQSRAPVPRAKSGMKDLDFSDDSD